MDNVEKTLKIYDLVLKYLFKKSLIRNEIIGNNKYSPNNMPLAYCKGCLNIFIDYIEKFDAYDRDIIRTNCKYFAEVVRMILLKNKINENVQLRFYTNFTDSFLNTNGHFAAKPLFIIDTNKPKLNDKLINFHSGAKAIFSNNEIWTGFTMYHFDEGYFINEDFHREISNNTSLRQDFWNNINN